MAVRGGSGMAVDVCKKCELKWARDNCRRITEELKEVYEESQSPKRLAEEAKEQASRRRRDRFEGFVRRWTSWMVVFIMFRTAVRSLRAVFEE